MAGLYTPRQAAALPLAAWAIYLDGWQDIAVHAPSAGVKRTQLWKTVKLGDNS